MKGDFDKVTYDAAKHYVSVLLQQGRVQLPSDFNEAVEILLRLIENSNLDEKGKSGSPNDGFKVGELIPVDHMDNIADQQIFSTTVTPDNSGKVSTEHFEMLEGKACLRVRNATSIIRKYQNKLDLSHSRRLFFALSDLSEGDNTQLPADFQVLINGISVASAPDVQLRPKVGKWGLCWINLDNKAGELDLTSVAEIGFSWNNPMDILFDFIAIDYRHPIIPWNPDYLHPYWIGSFEGSKGLEILDSESRTLFLGQSNLKCEQETTSFTWHYQTPKRILLKQGNNGEYRSIFTEILVPVSKEAQNIRISLINASDPNKKGSIAGQLVKTTPPSPANPIWYIYRFNIDDINDKQAATWVKSVSIENIPSPCEIGEIVATPDLRHDFIIVGGDDGTSDGAGKFYCNGKVCRKEYHETYLTQIDYPEPYPWPNLFSPVSTDKKSYNIGDSVTVNVADMNANKDKNVADSVVLTVKTDSQPNGTAITANEKGGTDTGNFEASVKIVDAATNPGANEIKGSIGDKLTVLYLDKFRATAGIGSQPSQNRNLLAYLDSWERHISSVEDETLKEVALGGPDTTTRLKKICQVRFLTEDLLEGPVNAEPWDLQIRLYKKLKEFTGTGTGRLSTLTEEAEPSEDPCAIKPVTGYSGGNKFYRVEIHKGGRLGEAKFKWSDVNGSLAARITGFATESGTVSIGATRIVIDNLGRDKDTMFKLGDYIEITDDANDLADYTQNPTLEAGEIRQITYVDIDENTISWDSPQAGELYGPLDGDYKIFRNAKVRKWDGIGTVASDPEAKVVTPTGSKYQNPQLHLGNSSIMLDFSELPSPNPELAFRTSDYWVFKTTELTREIEKLVKALPMGPVHHYCRLAQIDVWPADANLVEEKYVQDYRIVFPPLTDITASDVYFDNTVCKMHDQYAIRITVQQAIEELCRQRHGGLCSVVVSEFTGSGIQDAIDKVRETGGIVCIPKGLYKVAAPIRIRGHGITLQGEGISTVIEASEAEKWDDGLFLIESTESELTSNITIKDLLASTVRSNIVNIKGTTHRIKGTTHVFVLNSLLVHKELAENVVGAIQVSEMASDVVIKDNFIIARRAVQFDAKGGISSVSISDNKMFCYDSIIESETFAGRDGDHESPPHFIKIVKDAANRGDKAYVPNPLSVQTGDTVEWTNEDALIHTATSGSPENPDSEFDTGLINPGETKSARFGETGEIDYFCTVHPNMRGKIIVKPAESEEIEININLNWQIKNNWMSGLGPDTPTSVSLDREALVDYIRGLLENASLHEIFTADSKKSPSNIAVRNSGIRLRGVFIHLLVQNNKIFAKDVAFQFLGTYTAAKQPLTHGMSESIIMASAAISPRGTMSQDVVLDRNLLHAETSRATGGSAVYLQYIMGAGIASNYIVSCNPFLRSESAELSSCACLKIDGLMQYVQVEENVLIGKNGICLGNDPRSNKISGAAASSRISAARIADLNVRNNLFICSESCVIEEQTTGSFGSIKNNTFFGFKGPVILILGFGSERNKPHYMMDGNGFLVVGTAIFLQGIKNDPVYVTRNYLNIVGLPEDHNKSDADKYFNVGYGIVSAQSNVSLEENLINVVVQEGNNDGGLSSPQPLGGILIGRPQRSEIRVPEEVLADAKQKGYSISIAPYLGANDGESENAVKTIPIEGPSTFIDPGVYRFVFTKVDTNQRWRTRPFVAEPGAVIDFAIFFGRRLTIRIESTITLNSEIVREITIRNNFLTNGTTNGITIANNVEDLSIHSNSIKGFRLSAIAVSSKAIHTDRILITNNKISECLTLTAMRNAGDEISWRNGVIVLCTGRSMRISDNVMTIDPAIKEEPEIFLNWFLSAGIVLDSGDRVAVQQNHISYNAKPSTLPNVHLGIFIFNFDGVGFVRAVQIQGNSIAFEKENERNFSTGVAINITVESSTNRGLLSKLAEFKAVQPGGAEESGEEPRLRGVEYASISVGKNIIHAIFDTESKKIIDARAFSAVRGSREADSSRDLSVSDNVVEGVAVPLESGISWPIISLYFDQGVVFSNNICRSSVEGDSNSPCIEINSFTIVANGNHIHSERFGNSLTLSQGGAIACIGNITSQAIIGPAATPNKYIYNNSTP